ICERQHHCLWDPDRIVYQEKLVEFQVDQREVQSFFVVGSTISPNKKTEINLSITAPSYDTKIFEVTTRSNSDIPIASGTFGFRIGGSSTQGISFDGTSSTVKSALESLGIEVENVM